ncbi:MAG: conjugal transfer protein TraX [Synergistaceae bacterium]|jgi:hypothetical protein|nr:conjugal transfer protein TraX [Synergistaceae bacterium]
MHILGSGAVGPGKADWQILTGFHLKIIGIVLMVFDHIYQMFYMFGAPDWFTWLGRPVATIFLFLCAEGYHYTRSKAGYMLSLFVGFQSMNVISTLLTLRMRLDDVALINNIFGTLLVSVFYMILADMLKQAVSDKKLGASLLVLSYMLLPFVVGILALTMTDLPVWLRVAVLRYIPNPIAVEGGFTLVLLGVLFHLFRKARMIQVMIVLAVSALSLFLADGVQWIMALAVIPILLYNGKRGPGGMCGKYFFYVFYPAHIYLLYVIAWLWSNQSALP